MKAFTSFCVSAVCLQSVRAQSMSEVDDTQQMSDTRADEDYVNSCAFPFMYRETLYDSCVNDHPDDDNVKSWCYFKVDDNRLSYDGFHWGYCGSNTEKEDSEEDEDIVHVDVEEGCQQRKGNRHLDMCSIYIDQITKLKARVSELEEKKHKTVTALQARISELESQLERDSQTSTTTKTSTTKTTAITTTATTTTTTSSTSTGCTDTHDGRHGATWCADMSVKGNCNPDKNPSFAALCAATCAAAHAEFAYGCKYTTTSTTITTTTTTTTTSSTSTGCTDTHDGRHGANWCADNSVKGNCNPDKHSSFSKLCSATCAAAHPEFDYNCKFSTTSTTTTTATPSTTSTGPCTDTHPIANYCASSSRAKANCNPDNNAWFSGICTATCAAAHPEFDYGCTFSTTAPPSQRRT